MAQFIIEGGHKLEGSFTPAGNKNAALPMLAACLLTDQPIILRNLPDIQDVRVTLQILEALGVEISRRRGAWRLCARSLRTQTLPQDLCRRVRSSILFAGPLCARHGRAEIFPPGGDIIGRRRLDTHFSGLTALGARIRIASSYSITARRLKGAFILLDEASVTATENLLMAAVLARGETTLYNAACEPHVRDLGELLIRMGARIQGLGTNCITIQGVETLSGAEHTVGADYIEVGSFLAAAAATGGQLNITPLLHPTFLPVLERAFLKLGVRWENHANGITYRRNKKPLIPPSDLGGAIPKIEDGIWPAIPSDLMSVLIVLATQAQGPLLFFEKLFESRLYFVDQLIGMGARIVQCDPHRVVVSGPARLHSAHITSPDIRAGMALIIAALCARGKSVIEHAEIIDRGYERIDEKLRLLGARIKRVK